VKLKSFNYAVTDPLLYRRTYILEEAVALFSGISSIGETAFFKGCRCVKIKAI